MSAYEITARNFQRQSAQAAQPVQNERRPLIRPQVYVQVQWGLGWSQQHSPQQHSMTYMSRSLQNARDMGNFPRQIPPSSTNYLAAPDSRPRKPKGPPKDRSSRPHQQSKPQKPRHQHGERHREQERASRQAQAQPYYVLPQFEFTENDFHMDTGRRQSRGEARRGSYDRGRSAPAPLNGSPWDQHAVPVMPSSRAPPAVMKALPAAPNSFRLGTDDLPWDSHAWPMTVPEGDDNDEGALMTAAATTSVMPDVQSRKREDPGKMADLASLSTAMMTVDNGFEHQWWYQGARQPTERWAPIAEETNMSMSDPALVSAMEPAFSAARSDRWGSADSSKDSSGMRVLVSPISEAASPVNLQRSLTTRSEELFIGM